MQSNMGAVQFAACQSWGSKGSHGKPRLFALAAPPKTAERVRYDEVASLILAAAIGKHSKPAGEITKNFDENTDHIV
jgi:hypothetical protein